MFIVHGADAHNCIYIYICLLRQVVDEVSACARS